MLNFKQLFQEKAVDSVAECSLDVTGSSVRLDHVMTLP